MDRYEKIIYWSEAENKFIVEVPELAGCISDGATPQEALYNASIIIQKWIDTAISLGREIPEPAGKLIYA